MSLLPSGLEDQVHDAETLARFCTSSSWITKMTGRVKHQAFLPAPDHDTSVYRVCGMLPQEICDHAERYFVDTDNQPHKHHGAALIEATSVRAAGIDATAHEGPPHHANLRGWPRHEDPELQKSRRKEVATKIADKASFLAKS
jgi:hypothetical protein